MSSEAKETLHKIFSLDAKTLSEITKTATIPVVIGMLCFLLRIAERVEEILADEAFLDTPVASYIVELKALDRLIDNPDLSVLSPVLAEREQHAFPADSGQEQITVGIFTLNELATTDNTAAIEQIRPLVHAEIQGEIEHVLSQLPPGEIETIQKKYKELAEMWETFFNAGRLLFLGSIAFTVQKGRQVLRKKKE